MAAKARKSYDSTKALKLGRDLRISSAKATYGALHEAAQSGSRRVAVDGNQVEKADAAGLQALLAGRLALKAAGKSLEWAGASAPLKSAAELLGLVEALGLSG